MPIRAELKHLYPHNWSDISARIRFGRAKGRCEHCARPHGKRVLCLSDGRWFDDELGWWRDGRGTMVADPSPVALQGACETRVVLAAAHKDHAPQRCSDVDLLALCQRCHMIHDRPHHLAQKKITYGLRKAVGDLFEGPYRRT